VDRQSVEVLVHREPSGYWAEAKGLEGCFASGVTLMSWLRRCTSPSRCTSARREEVDRILVRVSGLTLEIEPDLRASSEPPARPGTRRMRDSHRDDWPSR
jgi:hypothetical protein